MCCYKVLTWCPSHTYQLELECLIKMLMILMEKIKHEVIKTAKQKGKNQKLNRNRSLQKSIFKKSNSKCKGKP